MRVYLLRLPLRTSTVTSIRSLANFFCLVSEKKKASTASDVSSRGHQPAGHDWRLFRVGEPHRRFISICRSVDPNVPLISSVCLNPVDFAPLLPTRGAC